MLRTKTVLSVLEKSRVIEVMLQPPKLTPFWKQTPHMLQTLSYKSSAGKSKEYWGPNSFLVKTGHTTAVIKLEGMLGARLVISPSVSFGL